MANTDLKSFLSDLFSRAFHTTWQTAAPLVVLDVAANHIDWADASTVSGRTKIFVTVVAPVAAATLSALKTMLVAYFKADEPELKQLTDAELAQLHINMGFATTFAAESAPATPNPSAVAAGAVITGDPA